MVMFMVSLYAQEELNRFRFPLFASATMALLYDFQQELDCIIIVCEQIYEFVAQKTILFTYYNGEQYIWKCVKLSAKLL